MLKGMMEKHLIQLQKEIKADLAEYHKSTNDVPEVQDKTIYFVDGSDGSVIYLSEKSVCVCGRCDQ